MKILKQIKTFIKGTDVFRFEAVSSVIKIRTKEEIDSMMSKLSEKEKQQILEEAKAGVTKKPKEN